MIVEKLIESLRLDLPQAKEIWIAVALIKEDAFNVLQSAVPSNCKQNYLVGVDLPTPPVVLRKLQAQQNPLLFKAAIYKDSNHKFHPKVYLLKTEEKLIAFIGSANLTPSGLEDNIEMSFRTENQTECIKVLSWFEKLFQESYPLDDKNIEICERDFEEQEEQARKRKAKRRAIKLFRPERKEDQFTGIDFTDRYFKREHHLAFRKDLWRSNSPSATKERKKVVSRFEELHEEIYSKFSEQGIDKLKPNVKVHLVSLYYHPAGLASRNIDGMWLSYGKDQREIKEYHKLFPKVNGDGEDDLQSFINHARMQIKISLDEIGIWILFGKNNGGSAFDRHYFTEHMKLVSYRGAFFDMVKALPEEYWILVGGLKARYFTEFETPDKLHEYCKKDKSKDYFIIGRDYSISDEEMSETNLPYTTLTEFSRLYPIYQFMRDKQFERR